MYTSVNSGHIEVTRSRCLHSIQYNTHLIRILLMMSIKIIVLASLPTSSLVCPNFYFRFCSISGSVCSI
jgi:hypothetical protein